jgi:hypothetical protein
MDEFEAAFIRATAHIVHKHSYFKYAKFHQYVYENNITPSNIRHNYIKHNMTHSLLRFSFSSSVNKLKITLVQCNCAFTVAYILCINIHF